MEGTASTTLAGMVGRSPRTSHPEAVATNGDPIALRHSSSPVACPGMVVAHAVRLVLTALGGGGPNGGYGEHHASRHGRNKPKNVPSRGRGDQWRSDRVDTLKLTGGLSGVGEVLPGEACSPRPLWPPAWFQATSHGVEPRCSRYVRLGCLGKARTRLALVIEKPWPTGLIRPGWHSR